MKPLAVRSALAILTSWMLLGGVVSVVMLMRQQIPLHELPWTTARAAGLTAYVLLTLLVLLGIVMSHPRFQGQKAPLLPWHRLLALYTAAFLLLHVVAVILDPYVKIGLVGALWPGRSAYRTVPVALGTLSFWVLLLTGLTARFAAKLPSGTWRSIHRFALVTFYLAFFHGILTGSDTPILSTGYHLTGAAVTGTALWRYWVLPKPRAQATRAV